VHAAASGAEDPVGLVEGDVIAVADGVGLSESEASGPFLPMRPTKNPQTPTARIAMAAVGHRNRAHVVRDCSFIVRPFDPPVALLY